MKNVYCIGSASSLPFFLGVGLVIAATAQTVQAQAYFYNGMRSFIEIEIGRPFLDDDGDMSALSGVSFFRAGNAIGSHTMVVVDIPFSRYAYSHQFMGYKESGREFTFGNPYAGIIHHIQRDSGRFTVESGVRIPLARQKNYSALVVGGLSDLVERMEAFVPQTASLRAGGQYTHRVDQFVLGARFQPSLWVFMGENEHVLDDRRLDFVAGYSAFAGFEEAGVGFLAGISGMQLLTGDLDERGYHAVNFNLYGQIGAFSPGLRLQIPVQYHFDFVQFVTSVTARINI